MIFLIWAQIYAIYNVKCNTMENSKNTKNLKTGIVQTLSRNKYVKLRLSSTLKYFEQRYDGAPNNLYFWQQLNHL